MTTSEMSDNRHDSATMATAVATAVVRLAAMEVAVEEVADALQARGLVRRRADPADRRATLIEVTEHGTATLTEIRAARGTEAGRVFGRLAPADRAELARILGQLRN